MKKKYTLLFIVLSLTQQLLAQPFYKIINLSSHAPANYHTSQCWNAMGVDSSDHIYIGFNLTRQGYPEDNGVFKYYINGDSVKFLGSVIGTLKSNSNYPDPAEAAPKGHSELPYMNGKLYMGTMPFHEICSTCGISGHAGTNISGYGVHRGSHLLAIDAASNEMFDLSKEMDGGVFQSQQGIMAVQIIPDSGLIACYSSPEGDLMVYNPETKSLRMLEEGDPENLGVRRVGRTITTYGSKIFYSMGWDTTAVYVYDLSTKTKKKLNNSTTGGMWMPRAQTKQGRITYLSTICGNLYKLDAEKDSLYFITNVELPEALSNNPQNVAGKEWKEPYKIYCMAMNADESKLYFIPSIQQNKTDRPTNGHLGELDLNTMCLRDIGLIKTGVYTGNNVRDRYGKLYFSWHDYSGVNPGQLIQIDLSKLPAGDTIREPKITEVTSYGVENSPLMGVNYPNPFVEYTKVNFSLEISYQITVKIYDIRGQLIDVVYENQLFPSGDNVLVWNRNSKVKGNEMYFMVIQFLSANQNFTKTLKIYSK